MSQECLNDTDDLGMLKYKGTYFINDLTSVEWLDFIDNLEIRDSDVFLVTYPKSGTIWSQQILSLIFNEGHLRGTESIDNINRVPWIEYNMCNMDFDTRPSPRLFSSHLPYYLMPKDFRNHRCKTIYVYRNPKDVMLSFYHFHKILKGFKKQRSWEEFIDMFMSGKVFAGLWSDHVRGWYTNKKDLDILFITYEEMIKDLRSSVIKISRFVDKMLNDETVDIIVEKATFQNMRHDPLANYTFLSPNNFDFNKGSFLRKDNFAILHVFPEHKNNARNILI
uniref:Sulfotransferase n=1 Tax=Leptobrachium leishanense TaxID=445787 RepID=A0A8C5PK19_9ANUR